MSYLQKATVINGSVSQVFNKHATLATIRQILLGVLDIELIGQPIESLFKGQEIELYLGFKGISRRCVLRVEELIIDQRVEIRQIKGLFKSFRFLVQFADHGGTDTLVNDLAEYRLPLGILGHLMDDLFLKEEIEKIIDARHKRLSQIFAGDPT